MCFHFGQFEESPASLRDSFINLAKIPGSDDHQFPAIDQAPKGSKKYCCSDNKLPKTIAGHEQERYVTVLQLGRIVTFYFCT